MSTTRNTTRSTTATTASSQLTPGTLMHDVFAVVRNRKSSFDRATLIDAVDRRGASFTSEDSVTRALRRLREEGLVDYDFSEGMYTMSR